MSAASEDEYVDPHRIRYTECPLCGSTAMRTLHDQNWTWRPDHDSRLHPIIRWMSCVSCGHQFTWGVHTDEALEILFGQAQAGQTIAGMNSGAIESQRTVWDKVVRDVSQYVAFGEWLDVGAGAGMLAATAEECGFETACMESRPQVAQALRDYGLAVLDGDVMNLATLAPGQFSVVSLCDLLEHTPSPPAVLDAVHAAMRPDSVLFISCPNVDSLAWRRLNAEGANPYYSEIEHYHNFGFRRLRALLADHGFDAVSCSVSNRYRVCMDVVAKRR